MSDEKSFVQACAESEAQGIPVDWRQVAQRLEQLAGQQMQALEQHNAALQSTFEKADRWKSEAMKCLTAKQIESIGRQCLLALEPFDD